MLSPTVRLKALTGPAPPASNAGPVQADDPADVSAGQPHLPVDGGFLTEQIIINDEAVGEQRHLAWVVQQRPLHLERAGNVRAGEHQLPEILHATALRSPSISASRPNSPTSCEPSSSTSRVCAPERSMGVSNWQSRSSSGPVITEWPRSSRPVTRAPSSRTAAIFPVSGGTGPSSSMLMTSARTFRAAPRAPPRLTSSPRGKASHTARSGLVSLSRSTD